MGDIGNTGVQFQVTPKEVLSSVQVMDRAVERARRELKALSGLCKETDICFQGKAKESFVLRAEALLEEWEELLCSLHNNVSDLQNIALVYEKAEGENINAIVENDH